MVFLEPDPFLLELEKLFSKNKERGSVWCYMKRSNLEGNKTKRRNPEYGDFVCLVRAGDLKKKICTHLTKDNYRAFASSYSILMRAHMDALKKKVKQKGAKKGTEQSTTGTTITE
eukprot:TRINITY_DN3922_c2_g1_i1.p5 TRINITY_DN3922_c2_g1~~TRINITY_DN3922_c2_g1_i1.p5  ORF type:complete len:115 (-),score=5.98 TRINITY_DN3922_c2_g1_i1:570-914(-)